MTDVATSPIDRGKMVEMPNRKSSGAVVQTAVAQGLIGASQAALETQSAITSGAEQNDNRAAELDVRELALEQKRQRIENELAAFKLASADYRIARPGSFWKWLFDRSSLAPPADEQVGVMPDGADNLVYANLLKDEQKSAADAQGRAKNWLAGITALIGLIATASVLSTPDVSDLTPSQLTRAAILGVVGFLILTASLIFAYRAAYGDPGEQTLIKRGVQPDMQVRVTLARREVATDSGLNLLTGVVLAVIGITIVLVGTVTTWLPPAEKDAAKTATVCVKVADKQVVKISGIGLTVTGLDGASTESC